MARLGDVTWSGQSGRQYHFQSWSFDTRFQPVGAVFLVTRRVIANENKTYRRASHEILWAGQTNKLSEPLASPAVLESLQRGGANCICVLPAINEDDRAFVLDDLVALRARYNRS